MKLALIQERVLDHKSVNIEKSVAAVRRAVADGAQLIAFPELGFEPFYPQHQATDAVRELAEPVPGPTTERCQQSPTRSLSERAQHRHDPRPAAGSRAADQPDGGRTLAGRYR